MTLAVTDTWYATFPNAHIGILQLGGVDNSLGGDPLASPKRALEQTLRQRFGNSSRAELLEDSVLSAYQRYYKRFGNTYHVQLQLESLVHKGKSFPTVSPLVDAAFLAELETFVLTASHDAARLSAPLTLDVSQGGEVLTQLSGRDKVLKAGDMMMRDARSVICSILTGQHRRTTITPQTKHALYVAYAPEGVSEGTVRQQLERIEHYVLHCFPDAQVEGLELISHQPVQGSA